MHRERLTRALRLCGAGCAMGLVLVFAGFGNGQARGDSLPPMPAAFESRCSAVTISPQVLSVGDTLTATAQPATALCGGPPDTVSWAWNYGAGKNCIPCNGYLTEVSGCADTSLTCTAKAPYPTFGWQFFGVNGSSVFGGWTSVEPYYVLDHQHEVSGQVTVQRSGGEGVSGVRLRAACRGGGTTTTDANGKYNFLLGFGSCTIAPILPAGQASAPSQRTVVVAGHDISNVNFQVSCGAGGQAGDTASAAAAACGVDFLKVYVKVVGPFANFGTRSGLALPKGQLPHFTVNTFSKSSSTYGEAGSVAQKCDSGCANVLVTVKDERTRKPVADAQVHVSDDPISHLTGSEYICGQVDVSQPGTTCGGAFTTTTDANGQAHLIYWAPGVLSQTSTKITVIAQKGEKVGKSGTELRVKPYVVYQHSGELTVDDIKGLLNLAHSGFFPIGIQIAHHAFPEAVEWLDEIAGVLEPEEIEVAAAAAGWAAIPLFDGVELLHLTLELHEQWDFIAGFLETLDLHPAGLFEKPFATTADALPNAELQQQILTGSETTLHVGTQGILWDLAKHLRYLEKTASALTLRPWNVSVDIYELTNCDPNAASATARGGEPSECGPGYNANAPGIIPRLYMKLNMSPKGDPVDAWNSHIAVDQYAALVWTSVQPDLKRALP